MTTLYQTARTSDVLAMLIRVIDDNTDDCVMPSESELFYAMHFERDNLISRWHELTGHCWPDRSA